ncbi:MAG: Kelch repeat-containing protein, partial [Bacteroidia bacterium]
MKQKFFKKLVLALLLININSLANAQWTIKQSLPSTPRNTAPSFVIGTTGYIVGGESSSGLLSDVWAYNPSGNSWNQVASFPGITRVKPVGFSINGIGYYGLGNDSTFFSYNPVTNTWSQLSSPPFVGLNYWSAMYFTVGNDAYFLLASSNIVLKYSTITNTWSQLSNFPGQTRFTGSGFAINAKGYVTCGVNSFGNPYLNDLWEYDPSTDNWSQKTSLPGTGRYGTLAVSLNGKGYLIGGERYSPNTTINEFWQYDPISDSWFQLQNFLGGPRA